MRRTERLLLWAGRIYLGFAGFVLLCLALVGGSGTGSFWSDALDPVAVMRGLLVLTPGLLLLSLAGLSERRRLGSGLLSWDQLRPFMYVVGCVAFALGVKLFVDSGLGVDPFHAMTLGIVGAIDLPQVGVGLIDGLATALLLLVWSAWNRRLPPLTTFVTMVLVGFLIDFWNMLGLERWTQPALPTPGLMLLGLLFVAYGSALIIMSGLGIRVVDLVALSFVRHLYWRFYLAKLAIEAGFLAVGFALGGPIGPATLAFVLVVGPFIEPMIWASNRYLSLPDYGLRRAMRVSEAGFGPSSSPQG